MKKILLSLLVLCLIPLLSGCGSQNKLKCINKEKIFDRIYSFTFDSNDVLDTVALDNIYDVSKKEMQSTWNCKSEEECLKIGEEKAKEFKESCKGDTRYKSCDYDINGSIITLTAELTKETIASGTTLNDKSTKEEVIKVFKDRKFTCE